MTKRKSNKNQDSSEMNQVAEQYVAEQYVTEHNNLTEDSSASIDFQKL